MKHLLTSILSAGLISVALIAQTTKQSPAQKRPEAPATVPHYAVQDSLMPRSLKGISDDQVQDHWNLYKGYVAQVNKLHEELASMSQEGKAGSLAFADRRRRYGFEYNGMVLHEYYFANLGGKNNALDEKSALRRSLEQAFGSLGAWQADFKQAGLTRGIGWVILYVDPTTGFLANHFIAEHGDGHIAGFAPILVMDVWEHAYMVDHKAGGRAEYIDAFLQNINWSVVEARLAAAHKLQIAKRF